MSLQKETVLKMDYEQIESRILANLTMPSAEAIKALNAYGTSAAQAGDAIRGWNKVSRELLDSPSDTLSEWRKVSYRRMRKLAKRGEWVNQLEDGSYEWLRVKDLHKVTASAMFGVPYGRVTDAQRQAGKARNFGECYVPDRSITKNRDFAFNYGV